MIWAAAAFGAFIALLGLYGLALPVALAALGRGLFASIGVWGAALFRLGFAAVLWFAAPESRTPVAFQVLAVLSLLGAVLAPALGEERIRAIVEYWARRPRWVLRVWGAVATALGGFVLASALHLP